MYSTINSLKVLVSPLVEPTRIANVADLLEGELGFFEKDTGDLIADGAGEGFFALMKNGRVLKSDILTNVIYTTSLKAYSAPTLRKSTITVPSATAGAAYQINVENKIPGLRGEFYFYGSHVAPASGADTTTIATALTAMINAQLVREKKEDYLTVTSSGAVITFEAKLQTAIVGHKSGKPTQFIARLTLPSGEGLLDTQTVAPSEGIGYGPYLMEKEYFAQGDSDPNRLIDWRNNFDWKGNAIATGQYDLIVVKFENQVKTASSRVDAPQEYIIAFNTVGKTNAPVIDASVNGETEVTGVGVIGSTVVLSVDGTPETGVVVNGSGVWTVTVTVATGEVLTAVATATGLEASLTSNAVTVTAT